MTADESAAGSPWAEVRDIFRQWEWLRLWYNAILVAWTLGFFAYLVTGTGSVPKVVYAKFLFLCVQGALACNLCFFAGPAVESYSAWLGWRPFWLRQVVFWLGTLFTALGAALMAAIVAMPMTAPD